MQSGEWIVIDDREYQLDAVLSSGAGSYGQVWAANNDVGRPVALKFINTVMMAQADPSLRGHWRAHLEREIAFLAGLDTDQSQHIVALLDHGQVDGQPVLVLERLAANLGEWLAQQRQDNAPPPDLAQILNWAGQILAGLEVIHHAGFVYRDLKFSNILVDERGERIKLADFGSLKRENGDSTRSFIGTPATMAPEQALPVRFGPQGNEYIVDYRADYYALGLLLFSLITRQPATVAQRRLGQLLVQHGQEGAARYGEQLGGLSTEERELLQQSVEFWTVPASTPSEVAAQLTALIDRLLARNPAERPQDSRAIRSVLDRVLVTQADSQTLTPTAIPLTQLPDWDLPLPPTLPPNRQRRSSGMTKRRVWPRRVAVLAGMMGLVGALAWAVVIRPSSELSQNPPIVPDAITTTGPTIAPSAPPVTATATPSTPTLPAIPQPPIADRPPEPVIDVQQAEPVVDSGTSPVTEQPVDPVVETKTVPVVEPPAAPVMVNSSKKLESKPAAVEAVAPPVTRTVAKPAPPAPKTPVKRPVDPVVAKPTPKKVPVVAKPEPKAPVTREPVTPVIAKPEAEVPATPTPREPEITRRVPSRTAKVPATPTTPIRDKPSAPVRTEPTVKATPSSSPTQTRPTRPVNPIVRAEPRPEPKPSLPPIQFEARSQSKPTPPALPPIRLESRSQSPTLPPINLISRTDDPPVYQERPVKVPEPTISRKSPTLPKPLVRRPADPVTQFQEDAARASVGIRRDVEALTRWMGRTGTSVSTEIQRGLNDADQTVTRWTRRNGTTVERRDRWSERARP